jgi:hypothetical protein
MGLQGWNGKSAQQAASSVKMSAGFDDFFDCEKISIDVKTQASCGLQTDTATGFRGTGGGVMQQNCRPITSWAQGRALLRDEPSSKSPEKADS